MLQSLIIAGIFYVAALALFTIRTRTKEKSSKSFLMAGANVGALLGFFTFAATLFSTFTLQGMPDFFRVNGIGAWIFLAISDAVMVFGIISVGYAFRKKASQHEYYGMAGFMSFCYKSKWAGLVTFFGAFIFLVPYVAIQIRGVAIFLSAAFPESIPLWLGATAMVTIMLIYSEIGGLKAIMYSDVLQGILLLIVIWIIGFNCLNHFGGLGEMFDEIEQKNVALLSVPGPKGLLDFQFLFGSMIAIVLLPFTQPQVSTRLIIMKDTKSLYKLAVGLGFFAILIILPTVFIGMYGAAMYPEDSMAAFLSKTFLTDQSNLIGAFVMIGLVAAAISTSDSQLFALGGEMRSLLSGEDKKMVLIARISIFVFALITLAFALMSSDELVLLTRMSFAGTALMAPMIFTGIFYDNSSQLKVIPFATLAALITLLASLFGLVPNMVMGIRMDLILLGALAIIALVTVGINKANKTA
ncbi:MAG: sodium:solute symporter family protein [Saprospiraceae bacterium]